MPFSECWLGPLLRGEPTLTGSHLHPSDETSTQEHPFGDKRVKAVTMVHTYMDHKENKDYWRKEWPLD